MKRMITGIIAGVMAVGLLGGCGEQGGEKVYKIGVTQISDHPSLDNCREGFIAGLSEAGYVEGENIEIDFQSAQDVPSVASQIAQNFASTGKDLVCGIATPSAQALYTACYDKGIPVIFNAVSDPVEAKLAVSETEAMDGVTGVSDALPVEDQLKLIRAFLPDAKTIGILYTTSEANSVSTLAEYKELAPKYGFEIVDTGVGTKAEIPQAADILVSKVDCISNMTDNAVVASLSVLLEKAAAAGRLLLDGRLFAVVEGGDASHHLVLAVAYQPANRFAVAEKRIAGGIEDLFDILVERAHPVAVAFVDAFGQVQEFARQLGRGYLLQGIFRLVRHRERSLYHTKIRISEGNVKFIRRLPSESSFGAVKNTKKFGK